MGVMPLGLEYIMTQRRSMFVRTAATPNPLSLKFIPGEPVLPSSESSGVDFSGPNDARNSLLARWLFRIDGIDGVFLGHDFITVRKLPDENWELLKPQIFATIMDFYAEGHEALSTRDSSSAAAEDGDEDEGEDDDEVIAMIKELIQRRVRPAVQDDGGDIFFEGFDEATGIVDVRLAGACQGCPSSTITLKNGVENMLMHYLPEVNGVREVGQLDDDDDLKLSFTPQSI